MSEELELSKMSEHEQIVYWAILKRLVKGKDAGGMSEENEGYLEELFGGDEISCQLKQMLSFTLYGYESVKLWSLRNNNGYALKTLAGMSATKADAREALLTNVNLNAETILAAITSMYNGECPPASIIDFASSIPESILTHGFLNEIKKAQNLLGQPYLLLWARKVYDMDESIPDEWVRKMIND